MVNNEIRARLRWLTASYSYEMFDESLMSDGEYDKLALSINPQEPTGNEVCDKWFREKFSPDTGSNIGTFPEEKKLRARTEQLIKSRGEVG